MDTEAFTRALRARPLVLRRAKSPGDWAPFFVRRGLDCFEATRFDRGNNNNNNNNKKKKKQNPI